MGMDVLIILILLLLLVGPLPYWPWSREWGYNGFYTVLVIVIIFLMAGYL